MTAQNGFIADFLGESQTHLELGVSVKLPAQDKVLWAVW